MGLNAHVILDTAAIDCFVNSSYLDNFGLQYVKDSSVLNWQMKRKFKLKNMSSCANALTIFQGVMNQIFHKYFGKFVLVYLDDILVFLKNEEEHVTHMSKVLKILRKH